MAGLRSLIVTVARSNATVLIQGESGTGKELIARALHEASDRRQGRCVVINCGAIPRELMESELFGHRKGAFTGAVMDRIGRFEQAHGGTIFLDEIGDLPLEMQVKLLRVLQERIVDPVGGTQPTRIDVRVVAATHRDLQAEVAAGRFREDLYYRLNVLPLSSPPLRERLEDVPELLAYFAGRLAPQGIEPISFDEDSVEILGAYSWPGNVRELANLVDRFTALFRGRRVSLRNVPVGMLPKGLHDAHATLINRSGGVSVLEPMEPAKSGSTGTVESGEPVDEVEIAARSSRSDRAFEPTIDVEHAILLAQGGPALLPQGGISLKDHLADVERTLLEQALARTGGNVSQTARLLRIQRTTLIEKLNKYSMRAA